MSRDLFVPKGKDLVMEIDMTKLQVKSIIGNATRTTKLTSSFSNKKLFVFVTLAWTGECIEVK